MLTECPHCQTLFRITQAQLEQAKGNVRCCRCNEIFNANERLHESTESIEVDYSESGLLQTNTNEQERPFTEESSQEIEHRLEKPTSTQDPLEVTPPIDETEAKPAIKGDQDSPYPELLLGQQSNQPAKYSTILWSFFSLLALAALLLQLAWFERHLLIQHPEGAKVLKIMCQQLGCKLPPLKNTRKIEVVSRNFAIHPNKAGILQLHLTIISHTHFDQVYPGLQLNLFNTNGQLLASRTFKPAEYLSEAWQQHSPLMPAQREIDILLELLDPGEDVTGFKLEFL